jgi:hypothetical protein
MEKINWREFAWNTSEAVIQIEKTNSPQDFLYAVSLLTDQGSSGFSWQECVYLKNARKFILSLSFSVEKVKL